ncbi:MAG: flagellar motor protein MotB [Oligoflexia bacterium]|nr:flagellar motor protein MotB [Oligoflexia bacterium]
MSEEKPQRKRSRQLNMPHAGHSSHSAEEGEGNWLVSYADMMTLLVGFFVILLSFSTIDEEKFEQIKQAATREFGGTYQVPYGDISNRIRKELDKLGLGNQFDIKQTDLGVEISFLGAVFFNSGSADIKPEGSLLLSKLIPIIKGESTTFNITVEGYTDDVPISNGLQYRSNWELSSVRSCRVLQVFEDAGFSKNNLTAVGYGETRPIGPNRDSAGNAIPENQAQNRRVVIKLLKRSEPLAAPAASAPEPHSG